MPLYAKIDYGDGPSWEGYTPTLGESAGAAWNEAWATNPVPSAYNYIRMHTATEGIQLVRDVEMPDGSVVEFDEPAPEKQPQRLSFEEQETRIRDAGLQGLLKAQEGYTQEALDILIPLKKAELSRHFVSSHAPASHRPFTIAAGLAASVLDPINVASAFVPVVGEARVLSLLGRAKGTLGRAALRAKVGLVDGAAGGALVEPLVYAGQKAVQADYDMTDSLINVGFGAIMGAGLQPLAGGVGDFLRRRRGIAQPWALTDRTELSESLRLDMAGRMERAFLEANPEADAGEVRQAALASAALYDARARAWAYDTGNSVEDYYARYGVDFRNGAGEAGTDTLDQAMYPAREMDIPAFVERVSQEGQAAKKSYFSWKGQDEFEGWEIRLPSDTVFHQKKRHPDMTDADKAKLPHALHSLEDVEPSARGTGIYGTAFLARTHVDGQGYGIVFEANRKGQIFVTTFFKDSDSALEAWLEREKKKAPRVPAASETESALSPGVGPGGPVREKLLTLLAMVKSSGGGGDTLFQNVFRARVNFAADGKAVIEFFRSSDFSSAPHELYHIFRRELAETALDPGASPRAREQWAKIEQFVGAKPGQAWTREMEEKFARAGERFLLEGKAPSSALKDVFERLKQWFLEIYADADAAGLEISPAMREVFNGMFSVPAGKRTLRLDMAGRMERAFLEANPEADAGEVRQAALASAALYDARARAWAYDTGNSVEDYYARYGVDFRNGEEEVGTDTLDQARIKSKALTLEDFADEARLNSVPSVFIPRITPDSIRRKFGINDLIIEIQNDFVRHLDNDHGKNANAYLAMAMDILQRSEEIYAVRGHKPRKRTASAPRYAALMTYEKGKVGVVVFELLQSREKGNRLVPITAYEGRGELVRELTAQKKPLPMDASIAMDASGSMPDGVLHVQEAFNKKNNQNSVGVNYSIEEISSRPQPHRVREKGEDVLEQAMYRSRASDIREFLSEVDRYGNQGVYVFGNIRRREAGLEDAAMELRGSTVQHIRKRHPEFNEWEDIEYVPQRGEAYEIPPDKVSGLPGRAFVLKSSRGRHVVLGYIQQTKRGQRFIIGTSFIDTPGKMESWLKQKQAIPLYQSVGAYPTWPSPPAAGRLSELERNGLSSNSIPSFASDGNSSIDRIKLTRNTEEVHELAEKFQGIFDERTHSVLGSVLRGQDKGRPEGKNSGNAGSDLRSEAGSRNLEDSAGSGKSPEEYRGIDGGGRVNSSLDQGENHVQTMDADAKLRAEVETWHSVVDNMKSRPEQSVLMLTQTPLIMKILGAEFRELHVSPHSFDGIFPGTEPNKNLHEHPTVTRNILKQLPAALTDPIFVLDAPHERLLFVVEVEDENGASIVIPVEIKKAKERRSGKPVNMVVTVFPYTERGSFRPDNESLVNQAKKYLRYKNTAKVSDWEGMTGVAVPSDASVKAVTGVAVPSDAFNVYGRKIATEADLVKARETYPGYYQSAAGTEPRARVNFAADGKAVIEFFRSSDFSSAPHELYHIFRRELAETALDPGASPRAKEQWAKIEQFVGAKPGQAWTREMEEKFARAGERFLLEGKAPSSALKDVFERLKQWFLEIYADADAAGLEISPAMREVFNGMFSVPEEQADTFFRRAVGELAAREAERGYDSSEEDEVEAFASAEQKGDGETLERLLQDAEKDLDDVLKLIAQREAKAAGLSSGDVAPELAAATEDIVRVRKMREVMRQAALCEIG